MEASFFAIATAEMNQVPWSFVSKSDLEDVRLSTRDLGTPRSSWSSGGGLGESWHGLEQRIRPVKDVDICQGSR